MTLLNGATTNDLARHVEDLAFLQGRAIQLVLAELTGSGAYGYHLQPT